MKLLSIIIAAYNGEKYIRSCLDSFLGTEVDDFLDVIVVDDGSTDNTLSIATEYSKRFPKSLRVIHQENKGLGSVFNVGIEKANGKYWLSLDVDDRLKRDILKEFIHILESCNSDCIYFKLERFNNKRSLGIIGQSNLNTNDEYFLNDVISSVSNHIHSIAFKTDILQKNNVHVPIHYKLQNDSQVMMRAIPLCTKCSFVDMVLYEYRVSDEHSSSIKSLIKNRNIIYQAAEENYRLYKELSKEKLPNQIKRFIEENGYSMLWTAYYLSMFEENKKRFEVLNHLDRIVNYEKTIAPRSVRMARSSNSFIRFITKKLYVFHRSHINKAQ